MTDETKYEVVTGAAPLANQHPRPDDTVREARRNRILAAMSGEATYWPDTAVEELDAYEDGLVVERARLTAVVEAARRVIANQIFVRYDNVADPMWDLKDALAELDIAGT